MARLRSQADHMPPAQPKRVVNRDWGDGWLKSFKSFDVRPIRAASIGQVQRARLRDGRDTAIKIQYPGVARSIDSDVANVGALIGVSGLLPRGFDLAPYLTEARRQLHEEADYQREGSRLARFHDLLATRRSFVPPDLVGEWTSQQVLAMFYVDAQPLEDAEALSQVERNRIAGDLIDLVLRELFEFGVMQTDPNLANYRYHETTGRIAWMDFGAARDLSAEVVSAYRRLLSAGLDGDAASLRQVGMDLGFLSANTTARHVSAIHKMIATIFLAIHEQRCFDFSDARVIRELNDAGTGLADEGYVPGTVPMDVLYIQRKLGGTFLIANRLRARLPISEMLATCIDVQPDET